MDPTSLIYLDYNATTPIHKEVQEAMLPVLSTVYGTHTFYQLPLNAKEILRVVM